MMARERHGPNIQYDTLQFQQSHLYVLRRLVFGSDPCILGVKDYMQFLESVFRNEADLRLYSPPSYG